MTKPIYSKLDKEDLMDIARKVWSANEIALTSASRKELEDDIKDNREKVYDKDLGNVTFPYPNASNLNIPTSMTDVRAYVARFTNIIVASTPLVVIDSDQLDYEFKNKLEKQFTKLAHTKLDIPNFLSDYFHTYLIDGIVGIRVVKEKGYRPVKEYRTYTEWVMDEEYTEKYQKIINEQYTEEDIAGFTADTEIGLTFHKINEGTSVKYLTLDEIIFPEDTEEREQEKAEFITYRKFMSLDDVKRAVKAEYYDKDAYEKVELHYNKGGYVKDDFAIEQNRLTTLDTSNVGDISKQRAKLEVWECYCYYDINNDGFDELCIVEIDRRTKTVFRCQEFSDIERPIQIHSFDTETKLLVNTRSYVHYITSIHDAVNSFVNGRINNITLQNGMMGTFREGSGFDPDEQVLAPGVMIPRQGENDITLLKPPEMSQSSVAQEQMLNAYRQSFSGLLDQTMPSQSNVLKHRTYRGIATVIGQGNLIIQYMLETLKPKLNQIFNLLFKYALDAGGLRVDVNINILNAAREMKQQAVQAMLGTFLAFPEVQQNYQGRRHLAKMFWETFGLPGFDIVFPAQQQQSPGAQPPDLGMINNPEAALQPRAGGESPIPSQQQARRSFQTPSPLPR